MTGSFGRSRLFFLGVVFAFAATEATSGGSWLGISVQAVSESLAFQLGLAKPEGVAVVTVRSGSPAARAGILAGDVILSYAEQPVESPSALKDLVAASPPGRPRAVKIFRRGKAIELTVTPEPEPRELI